MTFYLKVLLEEGAFTEQKTFLRSFIKRIDYAPDKVAISYTIPMPAGEDKLVLDEVLSMEPCGRPCRSRTCDTLIKSQAGIFTEFGPFLKLESARRLFSF